MIFITHHPDKRKSGATALKEELAEEEEEDGDNSPESQPAYTVKRLGPPVFTVTNRAEQVRTIRPDHSITPWAFRIRNKLYLLFPVPTHCDCNIAIRRDGTGLVIHAIRRPITTADLTPKLLRKVNLEVLNSMVLPGMTFYLDIPFPKDLQFDPLSFKRKPTNNPNIACVRVHLYDSTTVDPAIVGHVIGPLCGGPLVCSPSRAPSLSYTPLPRPASPPPSSASLTPLNRSEGPHIEEVAHE